jgi:hypothetical protein
VSGAGGSPSPSALAGAALRDLGRDGAIFARLAAVPFAWAVATGILFDVWQPPGTGGWWRLLRVAADAAGVLLLLPTATAWHRLVVLGRDHPRARLAYGFRAEEWRYLAQSLALLGFILLIGITLGLGLGIAARLAEVDAEFVQSAGLRMVIVPLTLVLSLALLAPRILVLPAAACGEGDRVAALRARARRAHAPVVFALLLVFAPWAAATALVDRALGALPGVDVAPQAALQFAMIAASLGVLSHAYLAIGGGDGAPAADA